MEKNKLSAGLQLVVNIEGIAFYVDTAEKVFRQKDDPDNIIHMSKVTHPETGVTTFAFDTRTKNVYDEILQPGNIPGYVKLVILPTVEELALRHQHRHALESKQAKTIHQPNLKKRARRTHRKSIH